MTKIITILFLILTFQSFSQKKLVNFDLYKIEDIKKEFTIQNLIDNNSFKKKINKTELNFGISTANQWLKIVVFDLQKNTTYKLNLATITPDTIEVFEILNNKIN